jgi:hypothetical protein
MAKCFGLDVNLVEGAVKQETIRSDVAFVVLCIDGDETLLNYFNHRPNAARRLHLFDKIEADSGDDQRTEKRADVAVAAASRGTTAAHVGCCCCCDLLRTDEKRRRLQKRIRAFGSATRRRQEQLFLLMSAAQVKRKTEYARIVKWRHRSCNTRHGFNGARRAKGTVLLSRRR